MGFGHRGRERKARRRRGKDEIGRFVGVNAWLPLILLMDPQDPHVTSWDAGYGEGDGKMFGK